jgi:hypothetical protein
MSAKVLMDLMINSLKHTFFQIPYSTINVYLRPHI